VRLSAIEEAYGDRVRVHWRAFPLIPAEQPGRRTTEKTRAGRERVGAEEPRARFVPPPIDLALPASSVPALTAAKCAERQGAERFDRFHRGLFAAHFGANADIGRPDVLLDLARTCGLDVDRFRADYAAGEAYESVLHDFAEGAGWFGVSALPTVVFNEKLSLVGAVPEDRYRDTIEWILAGEPGGVIALPSGPVDAPAPGQSVVGR
jgi:predicted DsbA family dithiol-disulfide isomerase